MLRRRLSVLCLAAAAALLTTAPGPASAAAGGWSPLQDAGGSTLAVALDDGTTALVSVGGPDDATIYDQRRTGDVLGPSTAVTTVADAAHCRPVRAATAPGSFAVAVECQAQTGLEDPPTRLAELVWTPEDGWASRVLPEGDLGSLDYSPGGRFVLFTSNSQYGRPHHLTSYGVHVGWRDLRRREHGLTGDRMVAAISDAGDVAALRGAGSEDEPGYWFGGRLGLETYDATSGRWRHRFSRGYADGGILPSAIDLSGRRITATVVESRSTGRLDGRDSRVLLLSGRTGRPLLWSPRRWSRGVLTASAAMTRSGVGAAAWQSVDGRRSASTWFATWAPGEEQPSVHDLEWRTTLTHAATAGRTLDLAVSAGGHGVIAYVRHRPGADLTTVAGVSFGIDSRGGLQDQVDATWQQPVDVTVDVVAGATSGSITLGRLSGFFVPSPLVQYSSFGLTSTRVLRTTE